MIPHQRFLDPPLRQTETEKMEIASGRTEKKMRVDREGGSDPELTGYDDSHRTSAQSGGVLYDAGVISGIGLERSDDTQHAFKRPHPRLAGSDFQPVRTFPSAHQTADNVFVQFRRQYERPGYLARSVGHSTTVTVATGPVRPLPLPAINRISKNTHAQPQKYRIF